MIHMTNKTINCIKWLVDFINIANYNKTGKKFTLWDFMEASGIDQKYENPWRF